MRIGQLFWMLTLVASCGDTVSPVDGSEVGKSRQGGVGEVTNGDFHLAIILDRQTYTLGEPIMADIVLTNLSDGPLYAYSGVLDYQGDDGPSFQWLRNGVREQLCPDSILEYDGSVIRIEPGQSVADQVPVFYAAVQQGWTTDRCWMPESERLPLGLVGDYAMRLAYNLPVAGEDSSFLRINELITSSVSFSIEYPSKDADRLIWENVLANTSTESHPHEAYRFLSWQGGDQLKDGIAAWGMVANEPDSIYAPYANFALGRMWSDHFMNFVENAVREADPDKAASYFEAALGRYDSLDLIWRRQTLFWLGKMYRRLGLEDDARTVLEQLVSEYGDNPRHRNWTQRAQHCLQGVECI